MIRIRGVSTLVFIMGLIFPVSQLSADGSSVVFNAVSKINTGTGFWVAGGKEYKDLLFFVTAEHVVNGIGVSSISCSRGISADGEIVDKGNFGNEVMYAGKWYFHPDDFHDESGAKPDETYDVAVTVLRSSHSFYSDCSKYALPIHLLGNYKTALATDHVKIMTLSGEKLAKGPDSTETSVWKDKSLHMRKSNYYKIIKEVTEIWAPNIRIGDSGSPVFSYPDTNDFPKSVIGQNSLPHQPAIYGFVSGARIKEKEFNGRRDLIKSNMGVDMVTAQRIMETINQAFFCWQTEQ